MICSMWNFDYTSVSAITSLLNEYGLSMSKKFGQNFLINSDALKRIVELAGIKTGIKVWEIGPGIGALTSRMLNAGAKVTAFEIDRGFCNILKNLAFQNCDEFRLIEGDVLKNWKKEYEENGMPDIVCANLPYNIGSVFIASLIEQRCIPETMVFTLQSEVVKRICSQIGDEQYSGFSILTSVDYESKEVMKLKSASFWPKPNVDSSVVLMKKRENPLVPENMVINFLHLCRVLFAQRRKTVKNNLKTAGINTQIIDDALTKAQISETERAEKLSIEKISKLSEFIRL